MNKICIIGNSVPLRVRPPEPIPENKNYTYHLRNVLNPGKEQLFSVVNKANGAFTSSDIWTNIDDYINELPDLYILHFGVVDACSREVPLWFYRFATKKNESFGYRVIQFFYRKIIGNFRRSLTYLRAKRPWVGKTIFHRNVDKIITTLLKETNAKIIVIPINKTNGRIEGQLPGSARRIEVYNDILSKACEKYDLTFIDLKGVDIENCPDGIHYSLAGHKCLAGILEAEIRHLDNFV